MQLSSPGSEVADQDLLNQLLTDAQLALACVDRCGAVVYGNQHFHAQLRDSNLAVESPSVFNLFPSIDPVRWGHLCHMLDQESQVTSCELLGCDRYHAAQVEISLQQLQAAGGPHIALSLRRVSSQYQTESIQLLQNEVLQAVAQSQSLQACMELLCHRVEVLAPEVTCTVLLVDDSGKVHPCAAPSMAAEFGRAIDGEPIGPLAGSCGTAAWTGKPVEVVDIATDPRWEKYRDLALPLGLAACWSSPIHLRDGRVAGTFALYYRTRRGASLFHRQMINACVHLCSLAIEHERAREQIHQLAFYDSLTGLPNRSLLCDRARQALRAMQPGSAPLALLLLDFDHFKTINESLGHNLGDQLLQQLAARLQAMLSPGHTLARFGGDELVLLLPETRAEAVRDLAGRLLLSLAEPLVVGDTELSLTASIGISLAPDDATSFEGLHKNAEMALYQAKAAGRNTFNFYQAHMNGAVSQRLTLLMALRRAIGERQLQVFYQPKICLEQARLCGVEALVRWHDPVLGSVTPDVFIPLAEESGLITALDLLVLETACQQLAHWRRQGLALDSVAVNLSALDFRQTDLPERIRQVLDRAGLDGAHLTLEITESLLLESCASNLAIMQALRAQGVGLSVDDFGTGYSSLGYLRRFPVTELKIDRSFVADLSHDSSAQSLARAVIQLGTSFGLNIIGEGVETQAQIDVLQGLGCAQFQGYFLARPMPAELLERWFSGAGQRYLPTP